MATKLFDVAMEGFKDAGMKPGDFELVDRRVEREMMVERFAIFRGAKVDTKKPLAPEASRSLPLSSPSGKRGSARMIRQGECLRVR